MNYALVLDDIFSQFDGPKFSMKLWDNQEYSYGNGSINTFTLVINDEKTAKRLLSQGSIGFGEAYMDGDLSIEGDIEAYLKLRHQFKRVKPSLRLGLAAFLASMSTPRDRKDQIAYHYDLGNDFFKLILDHKTMSYSAGRYEPKSEDLEGAQLNKIKLVCDWLDLPAESSVLDLGFGWGGFAKYAATTHKWNITGCTLSRAQLEYCEKLLNSESLKKHATLDYRDMLTELPAGQFDAIVMLESIEHVGKRNLGPFIDQLYRHLKPGGSLYIQTSGQYEPHRINKWFLKYVFPGGYIPNKPELLHHAQGAGFEVEKFIDNTPDYIRTLTDWVNNLERNRKTIEAQFNESFYRLWELWLHGTKVAFELNSISLFRVHLRKPQAS